MSTTTNVSCPINQWTLVSTGTGNCLISGPTTGYRIAIGAAPPANSSLGILISTADGLFKSSVLALSDNVYVAPIGATPITVGVLAS